MSSRHVRSVVAYWIRKLGVLGLNPGQVIFFFSLMQLPYWYFTLYKELLFKSFVFSKNLFPPIHHCMALLQLELVSIPPHKFVCPPFCYYWWKEIEKYDFRVFPCGIMSVPNFIQIRLAVFELDHADRQTWPALYAFISCIVQRMHSNKYCIQIVKTLNI
jgi:hypothetical protein